jgi:hypothetical protein
MRERRAQLRLGHVRRREPALGGGAEAHRLIVARMRGDEGAEPLKPMLVDPVAALARGGRAGRP